MRLAWKNCSAYRREKCTAAVSESSAMTESMLPRFETTGEAFSESRIVWNANVTSVARTG